MKHIQFLSETNPPLKNCDKPSCQKILLEWTLRKPVLKNSLHKKRLLTHFLDGYALEEIQISVAETGFLSCRTKLCL